MEVQRVVVALSRAGPDGNLLAYARLVADLCSEAEFHFVHVLPWPEPASKAPAVSHTQALQEVREAVAAGFDIQRKRREVVLTGDRVDRLLEYAAESGADLVLVGHRKGRTGRRSLARRLAMKAPCSVWMAPEGAAAEISSLVVGIDFSEHSAEALATAAEFARAYSLARCIALYVPSPGDISDEAAHEQLARFASAWDLHEVNLRLAIEHGPTVFAAIEQLRAREKVDLVVLGSRGTNSSAAVLLGAEADQMVMESAMPVLIVKRTGERLEFLETLLDRRLASKSPAVAGCAAGQMN